MTGSEHIVEMLRRSYFAVDGLWFVMLEEEDGPERAMELDERVWSVMPKIQARKARELLEIEGRGPMDVVRAMALKFAAEGHEFTVSGANPEAPEIVVKHCPWREALQSSDRMHLAGEIADRICATEGRTWAAELGDGVEFELATARCHGDPRCRFVFRRTTDGTES